MAIETKRYIEQGADGSTQLFQVPDEYIDGSLWVFEVVSGGSTALVEATDVGGGFYQLNPAPAAGSKLYLTYDVAIPDSASDTGLVPWEHNSLNSLLDLAKAQDAALKAMEIALTSRVTRDDFNSWAAVLEQELRDIKSSI